MASRLADGTFTPGRVLVTLDATRGRGVTGTVAGLGDEWRAVWSEGSNVLYEGRTLAGIEFNRRAIAGSYTGAGGKASQPSLALRPGNQATLTFIGGDGRVWVAPTSGTVSIGGGKRTEGWATRAFELAPARAEGYSGPRVAVDGRFTYLAWTANRANPGPYVTAADNTGGGWEAKSFNTLGGDVRLVAEGGRVRVAWTTAQGPGKPARVFIARRDTPVGAWAGEFASPEATTDQVAAALTLVDGITTLVIRSSLRLYTRVYGTPEDFCGQDVSALC
jgi:hypothetical protein